MKAGWGEKRAASQKANWAKGLPGIRKRLIDKARRDVMQLWKALDRIGLPYEKYHTIEDGLPMVHAYVKEPLGWVMLDMDGPYINKRTGGKVWRRRAEMKKKQDYADKNFIYYLVLESAPIDILQFQIEKWLRELREERKT